MKRIFYIILVFTLLMSCDNFLNQKVANLPADHTNLKGYAYHKRGSDYPFGYDSVSSDLRCAGTKCHHADLKGGIAKVDNVWYVAPSCYQCHGKLWKEIDTLKSWS